jgi:hypothetical protein
MDSGHARMILGTHPASSRSIVGYTVCMPVASSRCSANSRLSRDLSLATASIIRLSHHTSPLMFGLCASRRDRVCERSAVHLASTLSFNFQSLTTGASRDDCTNPLRLPNTPGTLSWRFAHSRVRYMNINRSSIGNGHGRSGLLCRYASHQKRIHRSAPAQPSSHICSGS